MDRKQIEGQISLWDFLKSEKPKIEPNDSVCEGCKWRSYKARELEVDEHGQTWVYKCPGTACANWRHGTPLNLSHKEPELQEDNIYCYNRDFLPELKYLIPMIEAEYDTEFKFIDSEYCEGIPNYYTAKIGKMEVNIYDDHYLPGVFDGKRFVSVDCYYGSTCVSSSSCDNLHKAIKVIDHGFERIAKERRKDKESEGNIC